MVKQNLLTKLLLLFALIVGSTSVWAEEITIATATFNGKNETYTEGWSTTGTGKSRTDCIIIGKDENITSPAFDLSGYSEVAITFTGRRYGTLTGSKATVDASIAGSSMGTIDITNGSVGDVSGSITFTPTANMTSAVLVFTCTNATSAGSTHGAGIGTITIKGVKKSTSTIPHNVTFSVNGMTYDEATVNEGEAINFPTNIDDISGRAFVGWVSTEITGTTDETPALVTSATMGTTDVTYYAVFATAGEGSGSIDTYELVTSVSELSDGDKIIIVSTGSYKASNVTYNFTVANGEVNDKKLMVPVDVEIADNKVTSTDVAPITLKAVTGGWKLQMGTQYLNIVSTKNNVVLDDEGALNTITIGNQYVATKGGITDGNDTRNLEYNPNSGDGRYAYYKTHQKDIYIYKQQAGISYTGYCTTVPTAVTATITSAGYATFSSDKNVDFSANENLTVFTAKDNGTSVTLNEVTSKKVPANTAVVLKGAEGDYTGTVVASAEALADNDLKVTTKDLNGNGKIYVLNKVGDKVGFYKLSATGTLSKGKAYLESENAAPFLGFDGEDTTGINSVERGALSVEGCYTLDGRRVAQPTKGMYIVNGKKVILK